MKHKLRPQLFEWMAKLKQKSHEQTVSLLIHELNMTLS